jgi:hypothetical protein
MGARTIREVVVTLQAGGLARTVTVPAGSVCVPVPYRGEVLWAVASASRLAGGDNILAHDLAHRYVLVPGDAVEMFPDGWTVARVGADYGCGYYRSLAEAMLECRRLEMGLGQGCYRPRPSYGVGPSWATAVERPGAAKMRKT